MLKFLYKINKQYDQVKEPKRFWLFFCAVSPAVIASTMIDTHKTLAICGIVTLLVLLAIRVAHIEGILKPKEIKENEDEG